MYRKNSYSNKIVATVATTIMITALLASLGVVAGGATMDKPATGTVRDNTSQKFSITVTNPSSTENVDNVEIWVQGGPGLLENWVAGTNNKDNLALAAEYLENSEIWIKRAGENLKLAADNKELAGAVLQKVGENLEAPTNDDWRTDSANNGGSMTAADNVWLKVESAATDLIDAGKAMDNKTENLNYIAAKLNAAGTKLERASGYDAATPTNTTDNLDNWTDNAAENLNSSGSKIIAASSSLNDGSIQAAGNSLLLAASFLDNVTNDDNITDAQVIDAFNGAAAALMDVGNKLVDAGNFIDNAGYAFGVAENYMSPAGGYIDNVTNLNTAGVMIGRAADNLENVETALRTNDNVLDGGDNLYYAATNLSGAADLLGSTLGGTALKGAASNLANAAENLKNSGMVNLGVAGTETVSAGTKVTSSATTMSSSASDVGPTGWAVKSTKTGLDRIRFTGIADNVLAPGGSETFTCIADVANIGQVENDYTLEVRFWKEGESNWFERNYLTLTVDGKDPSVTIEVTQTKDNEQVGTTNLINKDNATLTITASEELENIGPIWIENNDNLLPPITVDDLETTDNIVFTTVFSAGAWDDNSPVDVRVESATDMVGNENTGMTGSFTVDTEPPVFSENGLTALKNAMLGQKVRADGTTFTYVDNKADYSFSGYVQDNRRGGLIKGYNNVTVTVEVDGTTFSPVYDMPDNENRFFVEDGITLNEGLNMVTVTAEDLTGNTTSDNIENILIDTTAPSVGFDSVAGKTWDENQELINDNSPGISVTFSDAGLGVAYENLEVWLDNDSNPQNNILNDTTFDDNGLALDNANSYSWDGDWTFENVVPAQADGTYWIAVYASDNLTHNGGVENYYFTQSFTIDSTAPTPAGMLTSMTEPDGDVLSFGDTTGKSSLVLEGTADEAGSTVEIYSGDSVVGSSTLASGATDWEITISGLGEGKNELYVKETDLAGNSSDKVLLGSLWVDTTPPSLSLSSDTQALDGTTTKESSVLVEGTVTDGVADTKDISLYVRAPYYDQPQGNPVSVADDGSFSISVPLREGVNKISVVAEDEVPNTSITSLTVERKVTPWFMYAAIAAIVAIILAVIAILRRAQ